MFWLRMYRAVTPLPIHFTASYLMINKDNFTLTYYTLCFMHKWHVRGTFTLEDLIFLFLMATYVKNIIFWDVTSCSLLELWYRFTGSRFLQNTGNFLPGYTVSYLRSYYFLLHFCSYACLAGPKL